MDVRALTQGKTSTKHQKTKTSSRASAAAVSTSSRAPGVSAPSSAVIQAESETKALNMESSDLRYQLNATAGDVTDTTTTMDTTVEREEHMHIQFTMILLLQQYLKAKSLLKKENHC